LLSEDEYRRQPMLDCGLRKCLGVRDVNPVGGDDETLRATGGKRRQRGVEVAFIGFDDIELDAKRLGGRFKVARPCRVTSVLRLPPGGQNTRALDVRLRLPQDLDALAVDFYV
jgi:hypothetical protein